MQCETNNPECWKSLLPSLSAETHKYMRGYALVIGGGITSTGAARLAALAALRSGCGLVSVACDHESLPIYASTLLSVMTKPVNNERELCTLLEHTPINAALIGPGAGVNEHTRQFTLRLLSHKIPCVIDADAISVFSTNPNNLFNAIHSPTILTPHEGEFMRLFSMQGSREERSLAAAQLSKAIIVLKGHHTLIAAPDGRIAINNNAPAYLATAGSGDVLAGIIVGLLAQGMTAYEAACAAVWIHGKAGELLGRGLIAEDIPQAIPQALHSLFGK